MSTHHREFTILVVESNQLNLELLLTFFMQSEYRIAAATTGIKALKICEEITPDLILMDVQMPEMDGFQTAGKLLKNPKTQDIPIIFTSTLTDSNIILKCFESGGIDYISKPFKKAELLARIHTHLSLKILREQLQTDRDHLTAILHNMLPMGLIKSLRNGEFPKPVSVDTAATLFTDFKNFSSITQKLGSKRSVDHLNQIYYAFDEIVEAFGMERIKTIGDAYFAVGGINTHPSNIYLYPILAGLKFKEFVAYYTEHKTDADWQLRIGFAVGPVTSGVIGYQKIAYDVWGDTVNLANHLEHVGRPGYVVIPEFIYDKVRDFVTVSFMDTIHSNPWGELNIYFCSGVTDNLPEPLKDIMQEMDPEKLFKKSSSKKSLLKKIFEIPGSS
ncbi:adenylate/guanylate cyclase domain-containing protein [Balneolales bacterium ANBcel1]|nr:adenylate/guanylate cyclase domain-containing protein [Balneolales bacterium ANBcel1]